MFVECIVEITRCKSCRQRVRVVLTDGGVRYFLHVHGTSDLPDIAQIQLSIPNRHPPSLAICATGAVAAPACSPR